MASLGASDVEEIAPLSSKAPLKRKRPLLGDDEDDETAALVDPDEDNEYVDYVPVKVRQAMQREKLNIVRARERKEEAEKVIQETVQAEKKKRGVANSLLAVSQKLRAEEEANRDSREQAEMAAIQDEEERMLEQVQLQLSTPLVSVRERAKGIIYNERMESIGGWTPLKKYRNMPEEEREAIREKFFIEVNGDDIPAPVKKFEDMRLPKGLLEGLKLKGIQRPTQIQMQ